MKAFGHILAAIAVGAGPTAIRHRIPALGACAEVWVTATEQVSAAVRDGLEIISTLFDSIRL